MVRAPSSNVFHPVKLSSVVLEREQNAWAENAHEFMIDS